MVDFLVVVLFVVIYSRLLDVGDCAFFVVTDELPAADGDLVLYDGIVEEDLLETLGTQHLQLGEPEQLFDSTQSPSPQFCESSRHFPS